MTKIGPNGTSLGDVWGSTLRTSQSGRAPKKRIKKNTKNSNLIKAFKLRQQDTGWGYAFAHLIPFVGIFYAFSRKTITPLFIGIGVNLSIRFLIVILMLASGEEEANFFLRYLTFVTTPVAAKVGITKARTYAKKRLDEIE